MIAHNEGSLERAIRVVVGLLVLSLTLVGPKSMFGLIGLVPLMTGLFGYCPLYQVLGIRTCPMETRGSEGGQKKA